MSICVSAYCLYIVHYKILDYVSMCQCLLLISLENKAKFACGLLVYILRKKSEKFFSVTSTAFCFTASLLYGFVACLQ